MTSISQMTKALLSGCLVLSFIFTLAGKARAQQSCVPPPAGLVSYWPGEGNANDVVGMNHGLLQGNVTFTTGVVGQAFGFDGSGFVSIPDSLALHLTNEITLEFWFNYSDANVIRGLMAKRAQPGDLTANYGVNLVGSSPFGFELGLGLYYNDPTVTGGDDFDAVGSPFEASRVPLPIPGQFHYFVGTYRQVDPTHVELKIFINGQLVKAKSLPGNLGNTLNDVPITMGASFAVEELFQGIIDEVAIYNRALSPTEIAAIFNAGAAGKCKVTTVSIDIKPGSFPNSINPRNRGNIPVAILTTDSFDATTVDPTTARFGRTGRETTAVQSALEDVDGDGDTDMILHFNTQDTGIVCGDTAASLTGQTSGGQTIHGSDSIRTVGCKEEGSLASRPLRQQITSG